jgi:hypothetical protein
VLDLDSVVVNGQQYAVTASQHIMPSAARKSASSSTSGIGLRIASGILRNAMFTLRPAAAEVLHHLGATME